MLSSVDYYYLMQELQFLKNARLSKIYEDDVQREIFLFEFHVPEIGTKWLQIIVPEVVFVTERKITPKSPPGYCQFLRKKIQGMIIQNIGLIGFERIIKIELGTRNEVRFNLIIEMFSKGNMILTDKKNKIIGTWKTKHYGSRNVTGGTEYILPPSKINTPLIKMSELQEMLDINDVEIVKFLARKLGLGGYYAEFLLKETKINKELKKLDEKQTKKLYKGIKDFFNKEINPFIDDEPRSINGKKEYENFSQTLELFYKNKLFLEKKDDTKARISEAQIKKISEFEKAIIENQKKGELIYENYVKLQKILAEVKKGNYNNCEKIDHKTIKVEFNGN